MQEKPGSKAERDALSRTMSAAGCNIATIAAEMTRRWGFRPRTALRHTHGWSQDALAARVSHLSWSLQREHGGRAGRESAAVSGSRIGEYERWPFGGRRPTPYMFMILAQALDTAVETLLDQHDLRRMPPTEQALLAALGHTDESAASTVQAAAPVR